MEAADNEEPIISIYAVYMRAILLRCLHDTVNLHLYSPGELEVVQTLVTIEDHALALFTRIYNRKGPWFRLSDLLTIYT